MVEGCQLYGSPVPQPFQGPNMSRYEVAIFNLAVVVNRFLNFQGKHKNPFNHSEHILLIQFGKIDANLYVWVLVSSRTKITRWLTEVVTKRNSTTFWWFFTSIKSTSHLKLQKAAHSIFYTLIYCFPPFQNKKGNDQNITLKMFESPEGAEIISNNSFRYLSTYFN